MPGYRPPGVYIAETGLHAHAITGVATSTCAFIGPTLSGPTTDAPPVLLGSYHDFERLYGGGDDLPFTEGPKPNYLAHAVRAFFAEGGTRLHVFRVLAAISGGHDMPMPQVSDYAVALAAIDVLEDVVTLAAPGGTAYCAEE